MDHPNWRLRQWDADRRSLSNAMHPHVLRTVDKRPWSRHIRGTVLGAIVLLVSLVIVAQLPLTTQRVVWQADHESADLSQWEVAQGDAVFNSGRAVVEVVDDVSRSGEYALAMTIDTAIDETMSASGARIFRYAEDLPEAYYSAWFYIPSGVQPQRWWNIFQFKSKVDDVSVPTWVVNVGRRSNSNQLTLYLTDELSGSVLHRADPVVLPVDHWVKLEMYVKRASDASGTLILWQDGERLFHLEQVQTALDDNIQWSVNNYTDQIEPTNVTIYVDDAQIVVRNVWCHFQLLPRFLNHGKTREGHCIGDATIND